MKRILLTICAATTLLACKKEETIDVKDYGMKSFEAELGYIKGAPHGTISHTTQTYFVFGQEDAEATAALESDDWSTINLVSSSESYNPTPKLSPFDLFIGHYTANLGSEEAPTPYGVVGVLVNAAEGMTVAEMLYEDSEVADDISQAFADITLADISALSFSSTVDAIGHDWKSIDMSTYLYNVLTNKFFFVKKGDATYKLRFVSYYGASTDVRIAKFEYALMK